MVLTVFRIAYGRTGNLAFRGFRGRAEPEKVQRVLFAGSMDGLCGNITVSQNTIVVLIRHRSGGMTSSSREPIMGVSHFYTGASCIQKVLSCTGRRFRWLYTIGHRSPLACIFTDYMYNTYIYIQVLYILRTAITISLLCWTISAFLRPPVDLSLSSAPFRSLPFSCFVSSLPLVPQPFHSFLSLPLFFFTSFCSLFVLFDPTLFRC